MKRMFAKLGSDQQRTSGQQPQYAPPPGAPPPRGSGHAPPPQQYQQPMYQPPNHAPPPMASGGQMYGDAGEDKLAALRRYDMVFLIDDSESMEMEPLWTQTRDSLMGVVDVASKYDDDGVDVHFMNNKHVATGVRSMDEVARLFRRIEPRGGTPTASALRRILVPYMDKADREKAIGRKVKPLNVIIITDGEPSRGEDPTDVIVEIAKRLDASKYPPFQIGLQFVQVGDDDRAAAALSALDDDLKKTHGIRDMVDTFAFSVNGGVVTREMLVKVLLGGINRAVDSK